MSAPSQPGVRRLWPAALIFVISLGVYVCTLCPTVFVEGTGENIICAWTLGVPHPPGFPLFCILGKILALLVPVGTAAYRINLFAAVMGGVAAAALYLLLIAIGLGRLASAAAALAFAFSATFWGQAVIAEVYTLSLTIVIIQIGLLLRWRRGLAGRAAPEPAPAPQPALAVQQTKGRRKRRREFEREQERRRAEEERARLRARRAHIQSHDRPLLWFALAFGLGLTVHYNHILLLPAYLYFIFAHDRSVFTRGRVVATSLLLVAAGFSLHLYAPIRSLANPAIDWGNPETLSNWWNYLTAAQYRGRMFQMGPATVMGNLGEFLADLPVEFWWLGLLAAIGGAIVLFRLDRTLFWTTALIVIVVALWAINYDIPWEIKVYYLQALLAMAIWLGFGLHWAVDWLARRGGLHWLAILAFAVPATALAANFTTNDFSKYDLVIDNGLDILDTLEPKSALLLPGTNPTFALMYLTRIEGKAPGLELWSRGASGVTPVEKAVDPGSQARRRVEAEFVTDNLAKGMPVFAVDHQSQTILPKIAQVPWGCVYRLVPAEEEQAWLQRSPSGRKQSYRFPVGQRKFKYSAEEGLIAVRYLLVQADYDWAMGDRAAADRLYETAMAIEGGPGVLLQLGERYAEQGRVELATSAYQRGIARYPTGALLRNRLGALYGRKNEWDKAREQLEKAIDLQPTLADAHANLVAVYFMHGEREKAIEEGKHALRLEPGNVTAFRNLRQAYFALSQPAELRKTLERALRKALRENPRLDEARKMLEELGE